MNKKMGIVFTAMIMGCIPREKPSFDEGLCENNTIRFVSDDDIETVFNYFEEPMERIHLQFDVGESVLVGTLTEDVATEMTVTELITDIIEKGAARLERRHPVCLLEPVESEDVDSIQIEIIEQICTNFCWYETYAAEVQLVKETGELYLLGVEPISIIGN